MSKAVLFDEYGPPEVMRIVDRIPPMPGPGQVRVSVRAAGVQPIDCAVRGGRFAGRGPRSPYRAQALGSDFAGVVDAVGEGVDAFRPGDAVLGRVDAGAYAQHVLVDAAQIVHKPASVGWYPAAVLATSAQAAHAALQALAIGADDTLLVHAGAGGVGTFAVQLARLRGARVVATASKPNHPYLRSLGAEPVEYGLGLVRRVRTVAREGVTAVLDAAGGEALTASLDLVSDRRRIGTLVELERADELGVRAIRSRHDPRDLAELTELHASGKLQVPIFHAFPLERVADAHRLVERRHVRGKVVLEVASGRSVGARYSVEEGQLRQGAGA